MKSNQTIAFFDTQFERQVREGDFALNPFEKLALPYLHGRVLDMGCGLGNLSIEAARRSCSVLALDASPNAIARIRQVASAEALTITAEEVDFETYRITDMFDTVVAVGLFMFFTKQRALELLADTQALTSSPAALPSRTSWSKARRISICSSPDTTTFFPKTSCGTASAIGKSWNFATTAFRLPTKL